MGTELLNWLFICMLAKQVTQMYTCSVPERRRVQQSRQRRVFHSDEKSESAAVSSVAAVEEAFHDESRSISDKCKQVQRNASLKSGTASHCLPKQLSFTFDTQ